MTDSIRLARRGSRKMLRSLVGVGSLHVTAGFHKRRCIGILFPNRNGYNVNWMALEVCSRESA